MIQEAVTQGFRLSPQQEHLWRVQGTAEAPGFLVQCAVEIAGEIDAVRLRRALEQVAGRHEILRTTFPRLRGMSVPVQVVGAEPAVALSERSLEALHADERWTAVEHLLDTDRKVPFDLESAPPVRAALLRLGPASHVLVLSLPAFAADPASLDSLVGEVAAACAGRPAETEPLQYADVAEVFHDWLGSAEGEDHGALYWSRQDFSALLRPVVPGVEPSPFAVPAAPARARRRLDRDRTERLRRLAGQLAAPLPHVLLAAWAAALWHSSGEEEIVVAAGLDGRTSAELTGALGLFVRYLPVRCSVSAASTVAGLVAELGAALAEAAEWQDGFSPDRLRGLLERGWPLGFDEERLPPPFSGGPGAPSFTVRDRFAGLDRFGLRLSVLDEGETIRLDLYHDPARHRDEEAGRLLARVAAVLDGFLEPEAATIATIADIDVLGEAERRELAELNRTAWEIPDLLAHEMVAEQARRAPEATAVVSGAIRLTYAELRARANRLAHHLRSLGVGPESLVGICLDRSPEMVESVLGTLAAGAAWVPLDPGYPAERLAFLTADSGISALLTREPLLSRLPAVDQALRPLQIIRLDGEEALEIARQSTDDPPRTAGADNLAYVIYTSGSTGRPKGVMVHHRGLANYLAFSRQAYGVGTAGTAGEEGGAPVHSSLGFDLTITSLLTPLSAGAAVTLVPEDQGAAGLAAALRSSPGFDLVKLTPAHLEVLRQVLPPRECAGRTRAFVIGGEALWAESLAFWREHAPETRLINEYGPTETVVGCSVYEVGPADAASGPVPIGRPLPNARLWVVGPGLRQVPAGAPGELWIGGAGVARGYLGRPELTAERFVPDPFGGEAGGRLYRSGDLVRLAPHGVLEFLGRLDDQVKVRGFRIEPGEIEAALAGHPAVRECAVLARADRPGESQLVAYVVLHPTDQTDRTDPADHLSDRSCRSDPSDFRSFLGERLPAYMVPAAFVTLPALPLTSHGKVDRRALPEPQGGGDEAAAWAPPRTLAEELLAEVWARVLQLDRVGIDDLFFSVGGDSIRSLQVLSLAGERGISLTLQDLFQAPTIRALAERVRWHGEAGDMRAEVAPFSLVAAAALPSLPAGLDDAYPLTHLQAGMFYHSELDPDSAIYHDLHSFWLRGRFDASLLATAIEQVMRRHPLLRTSFDLSSFSEPLQLVHTRVEVPLAVEDLRHLSEEEGRRIALDWLGREGFQPFDWSRPPLARFQIHRFGDASFQFTLSFHHVMLDGWSSASLLSELFRRYLSLLDDAACPEEAPPSTTLREFVHLERSVLASAEARQLWSRLLDGAPLVRLPQRRPEGAAAERRAEAVEATLSQYLSDGLKQVARSLSLPLKSVLLGVHFRVLGLLSGLTDVVSGVVSNGRPERLDGEQAIGLFLNTLPLRLALPGGSWAELAQAAFELERETLPFRRFPIAELQHMQGGRPLFEISFNFLHFHVYDSLTRLTGLEVLAHEGYEETNFSLITHFQLAGTAARLELGLAYQTADYDRGEMEAMARRYLAALEAVVADPDAPYDTWSLLTEAERAQLLAWNRTARAMRLPPLLHEIFAAQAERTPDAPAAEAPSAPGDPPEDAARLTYRELDRRARLLAAHLRAAGVGPDCPVGMCLERSLAVPVAVLGILQAGGAYLPLDPAYPGERLAAMAEDAGLRCLVCDESSLGRLPVGTREAARVVRLGAAGEVEEEQGRQGQEENEDGARVVPENLAYVLYTSGSTGRPKGVAMPHGPLANLIDWQVSATTAPGPRRTAQFSALSFDASFHEMFTTWSQGGTLVLVSEAVRRDSGALLQVLAERSVEQLFLPFVALQQLADEAAATGVLPTALREVITAGEQLQATAVVRELFRRLPGCRLVNAYGPTETHVVTAFTLPEPPDDWPTLPPIGPAIANVRARVLDASLQPVPPGVPGEICFGGDCLARGYLGRPDLTAERFQPDPQAAEPGARVYRTGDLARYLADGDVEFLGRTDHQVKVRGFRVEPGEIEAALALHPEVREAAVVVREVSGPGDRRLVGYVVPRGGQAAAVGDALTMELRAFLAGRLPEHMVPWAIVALDAFPRTPSGKLDRRNLPDPNPGRRPGADLTPPRGPVEATVAAIWSEVLGCGPVGIHESFFDLGGHSLLATRVMSRVRAAFQIEIPLRALFDAPTVAGLAAAVAQARRSGTRPVPPLVPVPREEDPPLSFAQQRLWFLDQLLPGNPAYSLPAAFRFADALDPAVLAAAFRALAARHEVLRTTFPARDGEPVQRIAPPGEIPVPVFDLTGLPRPRAEAELHRFSAEEAVRPFELARGPLMRVFLARLDGREHVLLLNLHHIVSDAWSLGVLIREVTALYTAAVTGFPAGLPELPVQYADYAAWQRGWLQGEELAEQIAWWRQQIAGAPTLLDLPFDRPRPALSLHPGGQVDLTLPAELTGALAALSRQNGATLFMTLLAGWSILLSRITAQEDLLVGSPIANRNRLETEGLIGFFANTLVLRASLAGEPGLGELLARLRRVTLGAFDHQDLPFERLVEELAPERSLNHTPLFQVLFAVLNTGDARAGTEELGFSPLALTVGSAKFDLTLSLLETPAGAMAVLEYDTDLFDRATASRLLGHYATLLAAGVADPKRPFTELPLLTAAERVQILEDWNDTARPCPQVPMVHELFAGHAGRDPRAIAMADAAGRQITYGELEARSNRLAWHLRTLGVGPDVLVAVATGRTLERPVGILGIVKAGGAYLTLDPDYPPERLAFLLEDSQVPVLLTDERSAPALPETAARILRLDADWDSIQGGESAPPDSGVTPDNLAYVVYTSGSTGKPKGVEIPHAGLMNLVRWHQHLYDVKPGDRGTQIASPAFDASIWELWPYLTAGASLFIPDEETRLSSPGMIRWWAEQGITLAYLMTPLAEGVLEEKVPPGLQLQVRALIIGGDRLRRGPDSEDPGVTYKLMNHYGPAEYSVTCTVVEVPPCGKETGLPTIGRAIDNTRIYLLDRRGHPVPVGVPGELYVAGVGLARGYHNRPDLTAEKFVPDPIAAALGQPGERMYKTGDLVRWRPDGDIDFLGRLDHQVKIRGFRIELGEIEAALASHPAVQECAVLAREDGPGERQLVGYVVWHRSDDLSDRSYRSDPSDLKSFLAQRLPAYMVPAAFVELPALPLTPNGKIDRRALPAPAARPAEDFTAPRTPLEELIAGIWAALLRAGRVGIDDDFFALGGHSLLATQVISRVARAAGVDVPMRWLFEQPTVRGLAAQVAAAREEGSGAAAPPIVAQPREPAGRFPLSFAQQRLWFLDRLDPRSSAYNLPFALRLGGRLDREALAASLSEIVRRHEVLRTVFPAVDGEPVQEIAPAAPQPLPLVDLAALPPGRRDTEVIHLMRGEGAAPFDLENGPLLRTTLFRLAEQVCFLTVTLHHTAADGWSTGIVVSELSALYRAFQEGTEAALPPLPIQYADFAVWQRRWLAGEPLARLLAGWRARLAGAPAALDLPTDHPRPPVQTFRGNTVRFRLADRAAAAAGSLSRSEGTTLFMTLLAGFQTLLHRYSGQDDVVVGTPIAGRSREELEGLIGMFVNTLALRGSFAGSPSFRELLAATREAALEAYALQDLPFEKLVEELQPVRDLARSPIFQVMLMVQNLPGGDGLNLPGLDLAMLPFEGRTAKFEMVLSLHEEWDGLAGHVEYNRDLFDVPTIQRLIGHLETLLAAAGGDLDRRVADLPLLTPAEAAQMLEWNETATDLAAADLPTLFAAQALRTPEAPAVVHGDRTVSFAGLAAGVERLALHLRGLGVGPEVIVAVAVERSPELLGTLLAVLRAGGAYLPLDPTQPQERLARVLADSGAGVLVTSPRFPAALPEHSAVVVDLDRDREVIAAASGDLDGNVLPESLAYVLYTSGSTGDPKGVLISHGGLANYLAWAGAAYPAGEGRGAPVHSPIGFDLTVTSLFLPLVHGRPAVLLPDERGVDHLQTSLAEGGFGLVKLTPAHLEALTELLPDAAAADGARALVVGGEALYGRQLAFWRSGDDGPRIFNEYGPTEAVVGCCLYEVPSGPVPDGPVPIGRPVPNLRVHLLDRALQPVPVGVPGELYVGGAQLARGYHRSPGLTAERFIPDPFGDRTDRSDRSDQRAGENRLYRTGDLARQRPDGVLEYLGRTDQQVKIRGFRIEPAEVETALLACPGVREAVVAVLREAPGEQRLVAWVSGEEAAVEPGALREALGSRLPGAMIPSFFVALPAIPLTANGKVDRAALPHPERPAPSGAHEPPQTDLEQQIAGLWGELLALPRIGIHDNFFDLGGHSLLMVRVQSRLRRLLGRDVTMVDLFSRPTVASLARFLSAEGTDPAPARAGQEERVTAGQDRLRRLRQSRPADRSPR